MQTFKNKYWCIKNSWVWIVMVLIWCLISVYLSYQEWPTHWHDDKRFLPEAFRNWLFWASWSVPLLLIYSLIGFFKSKTIFKKLFFFLFSNRKVFSPRKAEKCKTSKRTRGLLIKDNYTHLKLNCKIKKAYTFNYKSIFILSLFFNFISFFKL